MISEADYFHAVNVWNTFRSRTIHDSLELFLFIDECLQVDVFQKFRATREKVYDLYPVYFVNAAQLA